MKTRLFSSILFLIVLNSCSSSQTPSDDQTDCLIRIQRGEANDALFGYADTKGKTVVKPGKYIECFTDTIRTMGIVLEEKHGFFGIDKAGQELFQIFPFDNGPDYPSEGLFRIVKNGKIGYADTLGNIIIKPQYTCAWPFEGGMAKVATDCRSEKDGEYTAWNSEAWYFIDRKGNKIKE